MRSLSSRVPWWALAVLGLLGVGTACVPAREASVPGNWKVTALIGDNELTLWLVKLETKDGKLTGSVLGAGEPDLKEAKLEKAEVKDGALRLTLALEAGPPVGTVRFEVAGRAPKGDKAPKVYVGTVDFQGRSLLVRLSRTEDKELDPKTARGKSESAKALHKALATKNAAEKEQALKDFLK